MVCLFDWAAGEHLVRYLHFGAAEPLAHFPANGGLVVGEAGRQCIKTAVRLALAITAALT